MTNESEPELRGRIIQHLVTPAQELATAPLLLASTPPNRTLVTGLAWVNIDSTCRFHYQVRSVLNQLNMLFTLILVRSGLMEWTGASSQK